MTAYSINPWLPRFAAFVTLTTFLLIIAGALVTSNDAGLSVPDWPTSFGTFRMPLMVGGVKFEHGHRMIAGTVSILTAVLALWLWRSEPRRWVRRLGGFAVIAILAQAALGGITVLFYLPVAISVSHACLAQIFFCLTVSLALFTRYDWQWDPQRLQNSVTPSLRQLAAGTTVAVFLQLLLGAAFRHKGFGIGPHIVGAVVVTGCVLWLLVRVLTESPRRSRRVRPVLLLTALLVLQLCLGVASYIMKMAAIDAPQPLSPLVEITAAHVAIGALVLASSLVGTLQMFRNLEAQCEAVVRSASAVSCEQLSGIAFSSVYREGRSSFDLVQYHKCGMQKLRGWGFRFAVTIATVFPVRDNDNRAPERGTRCDGSIQCFRADGRG